MATFTSPTKERITGAAARIDPASKGFVRATTMVGVLSFASAFAVSGSALYWAGVQIHLPYPLALPLAIDLPLIVFALSALSRRGRGQSTGPSMAWLLLFSFASVAINIWHALSLDAVGVHLLGSLFVASIIPIAILSTSEQLLSVLVAPPAHGADRLQREARAADRLTTAPATEVRARPKRGTPEFDDRVADIRDRKAAAGGVSNAELKREGFLMSEINASS